MKPETPAPRFNPEQPSIMVGSNIDREPVIASPEVVNKGAERYEQKAETSAILADVSFTTILPAPVIVDTPVVANTTIGDTPTIAKDDDLIEKEWVSKAKKIVEETRDNPYEREEAVNKLQIDYLKKRYGRDLGAAE